MCPEALPAGTLDTYRTAVKSAFYSKADIDVSDGVLEALPQAKAEFAVAAAKLLYEEATTVLGHGPRAVEFLSGKGTFHAVFRIETAQDSLYARTSVPTIPEPALDFVVDAWLTGRLSDHGVIKPAVRHVDVSRSRLPFDIEIVEAATGQPLAPGPAAGAAVRSLGAVVARVHALPCRGVGPLDPGALEGELAPTGVHSSWRDYVMLRLDQHLAACRSADALTVEQARTARTAFDQAEPLLADAPSVLLHGDLGNHNVFVQDGQVTCLIDWEDSLAGDPIFDVSGWGTFVGNHERRDAFLEGYRTLSALPADFELRYWLYFLRIMLAKTVHRQRFGYARTDRIPPGTRLRPALDALCAHLDQGV